MQAVDRRGDRRALHLRVLLPRAARLAARRASRCTARACGWASGSPRRRPVEADLVLPIPDSGTPAAIGFSRASGIPFSEGLIKNRYVGRTFIQPDQELRRAGDPAEVQPARRGRGQAGRRRRRLDRPRQHDAPDRGDAVRRGRRRGARAHLVAAGDRPVLLRDRLRRPGRARSPPTHRRGGARARSARPRSPTSRSTASRTATRRPGAELCRACLTRRLPDAGAVGHVAKLRFEPWRARA